MKLNHVFGHSKACLYTPDWIGYAAGNCVVIQSESQLILVHDQEVACLALDSSGSYIAAGETGLKAGILVWDCHGTKVHSFVGHKYGVTGLAFSKQVLASIGHLQDPTLFLWDLSTGSKLSNVRLAVPVHSLAFSPKGNELITVGRNHVRYWHWGDKSRKSLLQSRPGVLGEHKTSQWVAVSWSNSVHMLSDKGILACFDVSGSLEKWVDLKMTKGICIAETPSFILCGGSDSLIRVFEPVSLKFVLTFPKPAQSAVVSLAWHSIQNGIRVASVYSDHTLILWDMIGTQVEISRVFHHHSGPILRFAHQTYPDFSNLVSCSSDGTLKMWKLAQTSDFVGSLSLVLDQDTVRLMTSKSDSSLHAVGTRSGKLFLFDGQWRQLQSMSAHDGDITGIAFTPPDCGYSFMATAGKDRLIHLYETRLGQVLEINRYQTLDDHSASISSLIFADRGRTLASASTDKSIVLRRISPDSNNFVTYQVISLKSNIVELLLHPDDYIISMTQDGQVSSWSLPEGTLDSSFKLPKTKSGTVLASRMAMDLSGSFLAVYSNDDTLCVMELPTGRVLSKTIHADVSTMSFILDGSHLLIGNSAGCIFVWQLSLKRPLKQVELIQRPTETGQFPLIKGQWAKRIPVTGILELHSTDGSALCFSQKDRKYRKYSIEPLQTPNISDLFENVDTVPVFVDQIVAPIVNPVESIPLQVIANPVEITSIEVIPSTQATVSKLYPSLDDIMIPVDEIGYDSDGTEVMATETFDLPRGIETDCSPLPKDVMNERQSTPPRPATTMMLNNESDTTPISSLRQKKAQTSLEIEKIRAKLSHMGVDLSNPLSNLSKVSLGLGGELSKPLSKVPEQGYAQELLDFCEFGASLAASISDRNAGPDAIRIAQQVCSCLNAALQSLA